MQRLLLLGRCALYDGTIVGYVTVLVVQGLNDGAVAGQSMSKAHRRPSQRPLMPHTCILTVEIDVSYLVLEMDEQRNRIRVVGWRWRWPAAATTCNKRSQRQPGPVPPPPKRSYRFSRFILAMQAKAKNNGATSWIDCYFSSYTRPVRSECLLCCGCRFDWASRGSICCPQCHFHPKNDAIKKSQAWKRRR